MLLHNANFPFPCIDPLLAVEHKNPSDNLTFSRIFWPANSNSKAQQRARIPLPSSVSTHKIRLASQVLYTTRKLTGMCRCADETFATGTNTLYTIYQLQHMNETPLSGPYARRAWPRARCRRSSLDETIFRGAEICGVVVRLDWQELPAPLNPPFLTT